MASPQPRRPIARPGSPKRKRPASGGSGGLLFGLLLAAAAGGGGWWFLQKPPTPGSAVPVKETVTEAAEPEHAPASEGSLLGGVRPETKPEEKPEVVAAAEPEPAMVEAEKPAGEKGDFSKPLEFDELKGAQAPAVAWRKEALETAFRTNDWEGYRELLGRSVTTWLAPNFRADAPETASAALTNPLALEAITRHALLTRAGSRLGAFLKDRPEAGPLAKKLIGSPELSQALLAAIQPEDDFSKVLKVWADIYDEDQAAAAEWSELAMAVALVFDTGFNSNFDGESKKVDPYERYHFYKSNSEAGRLVGNIRRMSAAELVWVVSAPVPQAELEWALKNANFRQKSWGQAYSFIKYDMEKAVKGKSKEPYTVYSFEEIKKKGGICGDRAYFSAYTARACGVPAAVISGDGARGGHAWMTWMADEGEWDFSGRFSGYPAGNLTNPQTGRGMSEDDVIRLNDNKASDPAKVVKASRFLQLAALYQDDPERRLALLTSSLTAAPRYPAAGKAMLAYWTEKRGEDPVEQWTTFIADLRKNFRDHAGLMEEVKTAEETFVFARQDGKLAMRTLRREAKKVDDTQGAERGVPADMGRLADGFRRQAELAKKNGDADGVRSVYRRAMSEHGENPALFKALAKDFYELVSGDKELAVKACHDLENACRRYVGRGRGDYFDITSQNSAWKVVAECYTKSGDGKKAAEIEKDINNRLKKAERGAL